MRWKTWPVAAIGLGSLLLLIVVSMLAASRKAQEIYTQLDQLNTYHHDVDSKLRRLRSDVHLSGIFVRDYLLDIERARAPEYRQRLTEFRDTNMATVDELRRLVDGHDEQILRLRTTLDEYWQTFDPLFDWTPAEKILNSATFLRKEVVPRREAVLAIAQQIEELNNANLVEQRAEVTRRHAAFRADIDRLLWRSVGLGLALALMFVFRLRSLERRSVEQRVGAQAAERQMRELSQQLVAMQEEERKHLSRELHDHIGQVLTALRMELGRIERVGAGADRRMTSAIAECRRLVDSMVRSVRDLALGLRPSMLDDLGLQPALEWLARDTSRRCAVNVDLTLQGDLDTLPEAYRTCVYRVVQEALTNCVRHARAHEITVAVIGGAASLELTITDDGHGFDVARRRGGFGLRGIDERAKELRGTMAIVSAPGRGTTIAVTLPLGQAPGEVTEAALARAAG
jgi:signal transduction histidine kinase